MPRFLTRFTWCLGALEGLLIARLSVRLFAVRPDHPVFMLLLRITDPCIRLFGGLDAGQPQFGAVLELSTLMLSCALPVVGFFVFWSVKRFTEMKD